MLRASVRKADTLKRAFGDKEEWRQALAKLAAEGHLSYVQESDEIVVPIAPVAPV